MCQGYYRHSEGYTPDWPGMDRFQGRIVHPQTWPDDLDYRRQAGGGHRLGRHGGDPRAGHRRAVRARHHAAALAHLLPPGRNANELADVLRQLEVDETWIHEIVRRKILFDQQEFTRRAFDEPEVVREELLGMVKMFRPDYDVEQHFTPKYRPWRQRIAFVPDGDLFKASAGKASVVTDEIDTFTEKGILLKSGRELEADVIVTATGFDMCVLGDIEFSVDGEPSTSPRPSTYRGMMFTGVPNMAWVFGYFRASWTLRADLIGDFVCRLLNHMKAKGVTSVTPQLREEERDMKLMPWVDPENFNPGYLMRSLHLLPKQGDHAPWQHTQDYWTPRRAARRGATRR
jgi:cation diffusion facilitator CzcD-associated flavoprotein CzcO